MLFRVFPSFWKKSSINTLKKLFLPSRPLWHEPCNTNKHEDSSKYMEHENRSRL